MSRSLYTVYRPENWDEIVGNEAVVESISKLFEREAGIPNAILLHGPSGTGKTTVARIIKNVLGVANQDYKELDFSSFGGIDTVRELQDKSRYKPLQSKFKIYVIDEIQGASQSAMQGLLKWLEDCPKHVIIILATTDPQKILKTIKTRCNIFQMKLLNNEEMKVLIEWVLDNEEVKLPKKVISAVVKYAEGSPRRALTLLDNVIEIEDEEIALSIIDSDGGEGAKEIIDLCRMLVDSQTTWKQYQSILSGIKDEPESVRYFVLSYFNTVALREKSEKKVTRAIAVMECFGENYYNTKRAGLTYSCFSVYNLPF